MCELDQLDAMDPAKRGVSRRQFTVMGAAGVAAAACAPTGGAKAQDSLTESDVTFEAPGGTMDGYFVHPATGKHPAVILYPDIGGLRDAPKAMGRRLAASGYAVLVANPYYRSVAGQQFADFEAFRNDGGFQKVGPWMAKNTPEAVMESAKAIIAWLDAQDAVDTSKGVGSQGYCMTGGWTIMTAAANPDRAKAACSFHGGGLVGDAPTSPVNLLDDMAADSKALICIGKNDDERAPTDKDKLKEAGAKAKAEVSVEVYGGDHGWTVLDSPVYNEAEAERAWANMLDTYKKFL
ncbi:dienelactone hydrolase family protein [Altererythrobacter salegens]|uniref:Dienelactone hydrolase family protein n=1 Tax=Croceibacterium salegens TaxID=1737568 RepID=A0A6I4T0V5_9SPHN|nr:dienelactone hydrolase family protein [Croceibacterium salegens]MXO61229.1 dienelactone hydrolase family protein [Croceibacterium salegens]